MQFQHSAIAGQHDATFLSLLTSQRELLTQLSMESAIRHADHFSMRSNLRRAFIDRDTGLPMNRSIADKSHFNDVLHSKRLSLDLDSSDHVSGFCLDTAFGDSVQCSRLETHLPGGIFGKGFEKLDTDGAIRRKKRRLSSLGFVTPSFFEDHLKPSRRESSFSITKSSVEDKKDEELKCSFDEHVENNEIDDEEDDDEDDTLSMIDSYDRVIVPRACQEYEPERRNFDPAKVKSIIEAFTTAMEKSQRSQQAIHDWDRKMGLKRSHSKTMRLTTRSRKKLRSILKKDINALSSQIRAWELMRQQMVEVQMN